MTEEQDDMINDCTLRNSRLTEWESNFLDSLQHQSYPLTVKQDEILTRIWERVTG